MSIIASDVTVLFTKSATIKWRKVAFQVHNSSCLVIELSGQVNSYIAASNRVSSHFRSSRIKELKKISSFIESNRLGEKGESTFDCKDFRGANVKIIQCVTGRLCDYLEDKNFNKQRSQQTSRHFMCICSCRILLWKK